MDLQNVVFILGASMFTYALFVAICFIAIQSFTDKIDTRKTPDFIFNVFITIIPAAVPLILNDYPELATIYGLTMGFFSCFITARSCFAPNDSMPFATCVSSGIAAKVANLATCTFLYTAIYAISIFLACSLYYATVIH